ncbi:YidB family protein [Pseudaquabacterium pictum]|uniref:YidB family protein n=1 Tax=Pseudaquabacterium pictum TaxID=2315236 RepID=UPI003570E67E
MDVRSAGMGLLDSVLGSAMGALQGGGQGGAGGDMLMQVIGSLLQGQGGAGGAAGGLGALLQQLQQGGLGDAAQSWVSTGPNLPVSADQLQSALGADRIDALAQQAGLPAGDLSSQLAQFLPQVVDQLTPGGQLPTGGGADLGGLLGNVLGGLLRR